MSEVKHISTYIACPPEQVYAFASSPENLTKWAAGLARSEVRQEGETWIADAPFGRAKIRFCDRNDFGVMDHEVELDSGIKVFNPMRVIPNSEGSEFTFTLIRQPDTTDEQFTADALAVEKDLATLKRLLESYTEN